MHVILQTFNHNYSLLLYSFLNYEPCIRGMLVEQQIDLSGLGGFFQGCAPPTTSNAFEPPFNYRDTRRMLALDHNQPPFLTLALRCFFGGWALGYTIIIWNVYTSITGKDSNGVIEELVNTFVFIGGAISRWVRMDGHTSGVHGSFFGQS